MPELAKVHLLRGANRISDELHDGQGFLPQHLALSNEFEVSLQSVDAAVALPYWDFTRDYANLAKTTGAREADLWAANGDLWRADVFGVMPGGAEGRIVDDLDRVPNVREDPAAFPFVAAGTAAGDWPVGAVNAFGYMRSPWNLNRSPAVSRARSFCGLERPLADWPTCADHHSLTFGAPSLAGYLRSAGGHPHGSVHMMIGGVGGCEDAYADLARAYGNATAPQGKARGARGAAAAPTPLVDDFILHIKDVLQVLWRFRALDFPRTCDADKPAGGCHAACATAPPAPDAPDDDADLAWWRRAVFENDKLTAFVPQLGVVPRGAQAAVARAVCGTEWAFGDHAGAESPLDPSFWPMHPTLDRLLQYKRLVSDFDDDSWSGGSLCKYGATSPCLGHREHDLTAFKSHVQGDGAFVLAYLTNRELLNMTDPRSYAMTYIYDAFAWPHCADGVLPDLEDARR